MNQTSTQFLVTQPKVCKTKCEKDKLQNPLPEGITIDKLVKQKCNLCNEEFFMDKFYPRHKTCVYCLKEKRDNKKEQAKTLLSPPQQPLSPKVTKSLLHQVPHSSLPPSPDELLVKENKRLNDLLKETETIANENINDLNNRINELQSQILILSNQLKNYQLKDSKENIKLQTLETQKIPFNSFSFTPEKK